MDETPKALPAHGNGGTRPVTNADLHNAVEILGLNIQLSLSEIKNEITNVAAKQKSDGKAFEALVDRVDASSSEILTIRSYAHKQGDALTALELRTSPISFEFGNELVAGMAELRRGIALMRDREFRVLLSDRETETVQDVLEMDLKGVVEYARALKEQDAIAKLAFTAKQMKRQAQREVAWFGVSRDLLIAIITLIGLIVLAPVMGELINHFLFGKPF